MVQYVIVVHLDDEPPSVYGPFKSADIAAANASQIIREGFEWEVTELYEPIYA